METQLALRSRSRSHTCKKSVIEKHHLHPCLFMAEESRPAEHVEHLVPSNSQEGSSHTLDIGRVDPSKPDQQLCLAHHLVGPLLLVEVGAEGVGDCVGGNLVAVGVQVLHLGVVRPLVGHVEGGLDGAAIGVEPPSKEILVELLVQVVDSIVEGKKNELGDLVSSVAPGDVLASTVAILKKYKTANLLTFMSILWI